MANTGADRSSELVVLSGQALGLSQKQLAEVCGVSHSTAHRWVAGGSSPTTSHLHRLASEVYAVDPELAAQITRHTGTTLEAVVPEAAASAAAAAEARAKQAAEAARVDQARTPAPRAFPPVSLLLDSILVAAADAGEQQGATDVPRAALRAIVAAAFGRAKGLGLTIEEVEGALGPVATLRASRGSDRTP